MGTALGSHDRERAVRDLIVAFAASNDLELDEQGPGALMLTLPGEQRLRTSVLLAIGRTHVTLNAFVIRSPEGNHAAFFQRLLERNRNLYGLAYCLDGLGDVYLIGHIPIAAVNERELDQVLGSALLAADGEFNSLLELGFEQAIRREWQWRLSRGESTRNLEPFGHLAPRGDSEVGQDVAHET